MPERGLFDTVVVVDWSANATPKRGADSIWIAAVDVATGRTSEPENPRTRASARDRLVDLLDRSGRTLVGFDFPFGYPAGFAAAAGLDGDTPWRAMWRHLAEASVDDHRNRNNRWDVAADLNRRIGQRWFWGAPPRRTGEHLTSTKPAIDGEPFEFRFVERRLREHHGLRPFSCRQLLGVGSVGSQALTGIPVLEHLRTHPVLGERVSVWPFEPFEPGEVDTVGHIVLAEVWPSFLPSADIDAVTHPVKDARQVTALARHLAQRDHDGLLADHLHPSLDPDIAEQVGREEGWVLLV